MNAKENSLSLPIRELWRYRDMLYFLALRDYKIRFKQSALGFLWALIQPLAMISIFYVIFSKTLGVEFEGPYILFFLCGYIPWSYFAKALGYGSSVLVTEADLIKKVYFPRFILPLSTIISSLTDLVFSFAILVVLFFAYSINPGMNVLALPLFFTLLMFYVLGLSLWFGTLNVRFRDIQILLPFMIQCLFMLTPLAFPVSKFPEAFRWTFIFNPMAGIIEGFRYSLLNTGDPFQPYFIASYLFIGLVFVSGLYLFNRFQRSFADII